MMMLIQNFPHFEPTFRFTIRMLTMTGVFQLLVDTSLGGPEYFRVPPKILYHNQGPHAKFRHSRLNIKKVQRVAWDFMSTLYIHSSLD
jgi:hypothetical protein